MDQTLINNILFLSGRRNKIELYNFESKDNQVYYKDGKEFFQTTSNFLCMHAYLN